MIDYAAMSCEAYLDFLFAHVCVRASCLGCGLGGWIERDGRFRHASLSYDCSRSGWRPVNCREHYGPDGRPTPNGVACACCPAPVARAS